jgi:3-oxoacyl-[acyl-carrier protein] reductase
VEEVVGRLGRLDVLVNNAAIFTTLKMRGFEDIPLEEWERVLRVNITGCFLTARAVSPVMRKAGWGRIINITSGAVPLGLKNYLHYVTSKSALVGMTSSLARELGTSGITVNAVQPGGTFTEIPRETITEEGKARLIASQCIQREEVPMDLVGLVMFLSTEAASFITGQNIACDGGLTHW